MHVRQPITPALMPEGEPFVVDAQKVQQGRLKIMHVHRVARDVVPEFVRLAE